MKKQLNRRIADLKKQLEKLERERQELVKTSHPFYVDHEDAGAEYRHNKYLVLGSQIRNIKEVLADLEAELSLGARKSAPKISTH